ncbi:mandelate racemase/muconate lactonizing enzyme family protein [Conexibacter sp. S30A1]|uniref:mandelate racemase/muconate lactonizing enzyme family protein n=1 Tax=Conexibacter sp. S30A1 TaxID=2937800 RepID=UPI00200D9E05|nr:mandelate racemase/muconate lactonizing enzyme family protein [Conexibacter sp. S30A1]
MNATPSPNSQHTHEPQDRIAAAGQSVAGARIARVELYSYELSYVGGEYVMSRGRVVSTLSSTVVRLVSEDGRSGFGETCPLGSNYLPAHAAGARAALAEIGPQLVGADAANPTALDRIMDHALSGHPYAKSAANVACWDLLGQYAQRPVCDLLGGRNSRRFPLYVAISLGSPDEMREHVRELRSRGIHRFQLKLGEDPVEDAARAHAVAQATEGDDVVVADANGGWSLRDALTAVRLIDELPGIFLEQPCATFEECLRVRRRSSLPMILDEVITDVASLLRAWESHALEGFNLKISRVGGLSSARLLRDIGERLGLIVNIEDSWGGDLTTAAVSHLAASSAPESLVMVSFMNDWTNEHIAGYQPRSVDGFGDAPYGPGLGVTVDLHALGQPFASFEG